MASEYQSQIDPTINPKLVPDIMAARMARFKSENQAYNMEGHLVWKDKTGATKTSRQNGQPLATKEIFSDYVKDLLGTKPTGGTGSGAPDPNVPPAAKWKEIVLPDSVKTKVQLTDFLMKDLKMEDTNSKDYIEAFNNLGANLKLR